MSTLTVVGERFTLDDAARLPQFTTWWDYYPEETRVMHRCGGWWWESTTTCDECGAQVRHCAWCRQDLTVHVERHGQ